MLPEISGCMVELRKVKHWRMKEYNVIYGCLWRTKVAENKGSLRFQHIFAKNQKSKRNAIDKQYMNTQPKSAQILVFFNRLYFL